MSDDPLSPLTALPGVSDAVLAARDAVDRVLTNRVLRGRSAEVSAESALRGAWAAAQLSGADVELAALRAGDVADPVVQGALRVSAELGALATIWRRAPRQVLARLHVLAAADLVDDPATLGRPVADQVVTSRLDQLADTLTRTRAPAVVVAAVVLGEILGLDAFVPSSTVVGYAAARLTLVEFGLDPKSLSVIEVGALECRGQTPTPTPTQTQTQVQAQAQAPTPTPWALGRSGGRTGLDGYLAGTRDGLAGWIGHVSTQVVLGAREASAICNALERG